MNDSTFQSIVRDLRLVYPGINSNLIQSAFELFVLEVTQKPMRREAKIRLSLLETLRLIQVS